MILTQVLNLASEYQEEHTDLELEDTSSLTSCLFCIRQLNKRTTNFDIWDIKMANYITISL